MLAALADVAAALLHSLPPTAAGDTGQQRVGRSLDNVESDQMQAVAVRVLQALLPAVAMTRPGTSLLSSLLGCAHVCLRHILCTRSHAMLANRCHTSSHCWLSYIRVVRRAHVHLQRYHAVQAASQHCAHTDDGIAAILTFCSHDASVAAAALQDSDASASTLEEYTSITLKALQLWACALSSARLRTALLQKGTQLVDWVQGLLGSIRECLVLSQPQGAGLQQTVDICRCARAAMSAVAELALAMGSDRAAAALLAQLLAAEVDVPPGEQLHGATCLTIALAALADEALRSTEVRCLCCWSGVVKFGAQRQLGQSAARSLSMHAWSCEHEALALFAACSTQNKLDLITVSNVLSCRACT